MSRKKVSTTIYLEAGQADALKLIHSRTKIPVAEYVRQAADIVIQRCLADGVITAEELASIDERPPVLMTHSRIEEIVRAELERRAPPRVLEAAPVEGKVP
jgi:hypothetical protein